MSKRGWTIVSLGLGLLLLVSACGGTSASAPAASGSAAGSAGRTDKLTFGMASLPVGMDPTGSLSTPDFYGESIVFDALTYFDYSGKEPELKPALALSWTSKDSNTWEFKLRPNVKFQNGDSFTADDVKFTFDRILNPANKLPTLSRLSTVKEVKVVDPTTVDVITKQLDVLFPKTASSLFIVPGKYFQSTGAVAFNNQKPVGTGWYKVTDYKQKDSMTLEAFDAGWHGPAKTKTVLFKAVPENATRVSALKTGEIDVANSLDTGQLPSLKDAASVVSHSSAQMNAVYMQPEGPKAGPLKDKRVRQAMIMAVDKASIAKDIMGGLVQPATQSLSPGVFGYNPAVKQEGYDVNKAKALLTEAGMPNGFGTEMGATFGALANTKDVMEAYANMESKIGVNVKITNLEVGAYLADFRSFNRPPLWNMSLGWFPAMDAQLQFQWFVSTKGPDKFMNNQDFDKLYKQAGEELDQTKRQKLLQDAEAIMVNEDIGVWLYDTPQIYGLAKSVHGFDPRPDQIIEFWKMTKG